MAHWLVVAIWLIWVTLVLVPTMLLGLFIVARIKTGGRLNISIPIWYFIPALFFTIFWWCWVLLH